MARLVQRSTDCARLALALVDPAHNDEESIGEAVSDFLAHHRVARVIVVSNNSNNRTFEMNWRFIQAPFLRNRWKGPFDCFSTKFSSMYRRSGGLVAN